MGLFAKLFIVSMAIAIALAKFSPSSRHAKFNPYTCAHIGARKIIFSNLTKTTIKAAMKEEQISNCPNQNSDITRRRQSTTMLHALSCLQYTNYRESGILSYAQVGLQ